MRIVDKIGRRRRAMQNRGLRPLFPKLPENCDSRLLRVAMKTRNWLLLDKLVAASDSPTRPRAVGEVLEFAIALVSADATYTGREMDWQRWQIEKETALLEGEFGIHSNGISKHEESSSQWQQ